MNQLIEQYLSALSGGRYSPVTALCGRILRGKKPADFETLTDDPSRLLVMFMGPDGLQTLLGKNGYEMLVAIGYQPDYLEHKVKEGNLFKLAVFPEGRAAKLATWDNVIEMVSEVYPVIKSDLVRALPELIRRPFSYWNAVAATRGFDSPVTANGSSVFLPVEKAGKQHENFMTYERFLASRRDEFSVRSFLYFSVHLRELFSGDGYTYDDQGKRGMMEYIGRNLKISELGEYQLVDINVVLPQNQIGKGASSMPATTSASTRSLPLPSFYNPKTVGEVWRVPYQDRVNDAREWAKRHKISPSAKDKFKIALLAIDVQNTFCIPDFELFVRGQSGTGAVDDCRRLCEFVYRNLGVITSIFPTMDTHTAMQIFHEVFLIDDQGNHPMPFSSVSLKEIQTGKWRVNPAIAHSLARKIGVDPGRLMPMLQKHLLHYATELSRGGKYDLTIWPYHAMLGGIGHALVSAFHEAEFFHTMVRNSQTGYEIKGGNPYTENYSILRPEVLTGPNGISIGAQKNTEFLEHLLVYDAVIIGGQAGSHCVPWTIDDLLNEILQKAPELAQKVYILENCTSPVVVPGVIDYTPQMEAAFSRFVGEGMNKVKSTDPIESWRGINL